MKKSQIILIFISFLAISCGKEKASSTVERTQHSKSIYNIQGFRKVFVKPKKKPKPKKASKIDNIEQFLSLFKAIDENGFFVESKYEFLGETYQEPVSFSKIQYEAIETFYEKVYNERLGSYDVYGLKTIYPLFKYKISENYIGLLILSHNYYVEQYDIVELITFRLEDSTFVQKVHLAEDWGDGGIVFQTRTWFTDFNNDTITDIITEKTYFSPTNSDFDVFKGNYVDSIFVYIGTGASYKKLYVESKIIYTLSDHGFKFTKIKDRSHDTVFFDPKYKQNIQVDFEKYRNQKRTSLKLE